MRIHLLTLLLSLASTLAAVADDTPRSTAISAERLSEHVRVMASDAFAGRAPGGPGEQPTVDYLVEQFKAIGLSPGGENGTWTQAVNLWHTQRGIGHRHKKTETSERCNKGGDTHEKNYFPILVE